MSSDGSRLDSFFTQFKIDYAKTKSLAIGDAMSRDVSVGGHSWRIRCFPCGSTAEDKGEYVDVSISFELTGGGSIGGVVINSIFEAFITKPDGKPSLSRSKRTAVQSYRSLFPSEILLPLGFQQLVKRSDLESLSDGKATITCGVIVVHDAGDPFDVPPSDIGTHLGLLLDSTDGSDVTFLVDGERFSAHRAVLAARSPVFKEQLLGSTSAKAKTTPIVVHDIAPATFKAMLRFMYTDACPADGELGGSPCEMFQCLLAAADRYALDRLKLVCAKKLWDGVSAENVAATLVCAEACRCPELKRKCVSFLVDEKNFRDAVLTDGFVQLVQKFPGIVAELKADAKREAVKHQA